MKKINQKISKYNHSSRNGNKVKYIVIHWVGAVSTAKNNATYFAGGNRNASAHYFVDATSIWQSVKDAYAAWHCGGGLQGSGGHSFYGQCKNANSIGIEMCLDRKGHIADATIKNTAELVKYLQKKYDIPDSRVIRHFDVTGKACPGPYIKTAAWEKLHAILVGEAAAPAKKKKPSVPKPVLRRGKKGNKVKQLQECLNYLGFKTPVDKSWGPDMDKKFGAFQMKYKLTKDLSYGPKCYKKMKSLI